MLRRMRRQGEFRKRIGRVWRDLGNGGGKKGGSRRDWWWKQDNGVESESGRVKDYVMEWIGSEISKENRSKPEWNNLESPSSVDNSLLTATSLKIEKKKKKIRNRKIGPRTEVKKKQSKSKGMGSQDASTFRQ